jgi:hypothetical protein
MKIGKWFIFFLKLIVYNVIYVYYFLEGVVQKRLDKDYVGRYVHPCTVVEEFLFPFNKLAGGLKNEARITLYIPPIPVCANPATTTIDLIVHEVLHQVLGDTIDDKASSALDTIQDGMFTIWAYVDKPHQEIAYIMFWVWERTEKFK